MANDGTVKIGTELDESGLSKGLSGLGDIAKKGVAVAGGIAAAGVAAAGAVTKAALDSVASLEQNIGGVETLFGATEEEIKRHIEVFGEADASLTQLQNREKTVLDNANKAYKTAGISANEYMSTVNSFAASLTSSLGDYAWQAGNYADMAVTDMADNANKMGSSMESIQNAYQGFAKQNYTMLDNLKLGYGGTKTEMERLLRDAEKYAGLIEGSLSIESFADVVDAIHIVQEEMGITGTTAKEAATTIEGSMNSAKAAWDNFLSGAGTAEELTESLVTAGEVVLKNLGEIIPRLAETIPEAASMIISGISGSLPQFAELGLQVTENVVAGLVGSLPRLFEMGLQLVDYLWSGLQEAAPQLLEAGMQMLARLGEGVQSAIPALVANALPIAVDFSSKLREGAGQLVNAGIAFVEKILVGLIRALPDLIAYVPVIITNIVGVINDNVPKLIAAGAAMILELIVGIVGCIPDLIANFPAIVEMIFSVITAVNWVGLGGKIITGIANGVKSLASAAVNAVKSVGQNGFKVFQGISWSDLGSGLIRKIASGIGSLITSIPSKLKSIGQTAMQAFKGLSWSSVGSNIISGIVSGIASAAGNLVNAAVNAASNAINTVKGWLGIHSPSRKAKKEIGIPLIAGAAEGAEEAAPEFEKAAVGSAEDAVEAMKKASAADFVARMQAKSYKMAENNEMAARSKYKNNGYDPDNPDDDGGMTIHNQFNVDGKPLVDETVKKTKKEIAKEQRSNQAVKGDVVFA